MMFYALKVWIWVLISSASTGELQSKDVWGLADLEPDTLQWDDPAIFLRWEFPDHERLWQKAGSDIPFLKAYRDSLRMVLGSKDLGLAIGIQSTQSWTRDKIPPVKDGDGFNAALVHTGTVGYVRPINEMEAQILNYQLCRYPLLSHPTEFHGFILKHPESKHVRVYFAASDQPWPPKPGVIIDAVTSDLMQGWQLRYHLHNHYEPPADQYIGVLAPSLADAHYFKALVQRFDLRQALITNGFHTVVLDSEDFKKFQSH